MSSLDLGARGPLGVPYRQLADGGSDRDPGSKRDMEWIVGPHVVRAGPAEVAGRLQSHFEALLETNPALQSILADVTAAGARPVVFGGWVRDLLVRDRALRKGHLRHAALRPADLDLVFDRTTANDLARDLPQTARRNLFNGFALDAGSLKIDCWALEDTQTIARWGWPLTVDLLPLTASFSVEAVIFKPSPWWESSEVLDAGMLGSIRSGTLDLGAGEIALPEVQVGRGIQYLVKLGLEPTPALEAWMQAVLQVQGAFDRVETGLRQYAHLEYRDAALAHLATMRREREVVAKQGRARQPGA